ncbi:MAG: TonB-dependent receptor, partial [Bergeyella zoohelcum]|nr:TonB-dependent receptor [Bergeyella zoohelcum]
VKGYTSLDFAKLYNLSFNFKYDFAENWQWKGSLTYARAKDHTGGNLPFIRPMSYLTSLRLRQYPFSVFASVQGDLAQNHFSPEYGEDRTPAYTIMDISADYSWVFCHQAVTLQAGVQNLFNQYYTTYADWGNIPRMGRNIFVGMKINF